MLRALEIYEREKGKSKPESEPVQTQHERDHERRTPPRETDRDLDTERTTVTICAESGLRATPACPTTYQITYDAGGEPSETCTLHGAGTGEHPAQPTPPTPAPTAPAAPSPGPTRPGVQPRVSVRYVTITICVDSGHIANIYCPETIPRRFRADEAPTKVCRLHKSPAR